MSEQDIDERFLVVGGGIGGLAAALGLSSLGYGVRIFEQSDDFREVGAGIQIAPNGRRAIRGLGIEAEFDRYAWRPPALVLRDAFTGKVLTRFPLTDGFQEKFGDPYSVIHRADLLAILLNACRSNPRISLETGSRVVSVRDTESNVSVSLIGGSQAKGVGLVGADGLWSVVRRTVINDGLPAPPRHVVYRGVIPRTHLPDDLWSEDVVMWAGPGADFVHYPLRGGELFNLVASFRTDRELDPSEVQGSRADLMGPFCGYAPEVLRLLALMNPDRRWLVTDREPVKQWSRGRITLLGDAAHPMLQYLAQGSCQALEDAVQLTEEVARKPEDISSAFEAYGNARYLRAARVQLTARWFIGVCQAGGLLAEIRAKVFARRSVEQAYDAVAWLYSPDEQFG